MCCKDKVIRKSEFSFVTMMPALPADVRKKNRNVTPREGPPPDTYIRLRFQQNLINISLFTTVG